MVVRTGDNGMNQLTGTDGADELYGLGGNDLLTGKKGNDRLDGGSGSDFAIYTGSQNGVTIDLTLGIATGEGNDTLLGIENIDGSMRNDTITLAGGNNFANGNGGNDVIYGLAGTDYLLGGDGDDRLYAGSGYDEILNGQDGDDFLAAGHGDGTSIEGGSDLDTVSYLDSDIGVNLLLYDGSAYDRGGFGTDREFFHNIQSVENAEGSTFADSIRGDAGSNLLKGLQGDDEIHGEEGIDTVEGGAGADRLWGDAGADTLRGGDGDDRLEGGAQADRLFGGGHNDYLHGGDGNDVLTGGNGRDFLTGGNGADRYDFDTTAETAVGANRDQINEFFRSDGDRIDLGDIDARTDQGGNQAFSFIGGNNFSAAGQLRATQVNGGDWLIQGSTDGDAQAELEIYVWTAGNGFNTGDFVL